MILPTSPSFKKFLSDTSITIFGKSGKVTPKVKFLDVTNDNHKRMKYNVEHLKSACHKSRMNIAKLNSIIATLLIRLQEVFVRLYMNYACTALTTLNKKERQNRANFKPLFLFVFLMRNFGVNVLL